jgi:hypothetical protein
LVLLGCSSRYRLGRIEGGEVTGAGGAQAASGGGTSNAGTNGRSDPPGHAGEAAAGAGAEPHPEPGDFVVH